MKARINIGISAQNRGAKWYVLEGAEYKVFRDPENGCYWEFGGQSQELHNIYPWFGKDEPAIIEFGDKIMAVLASKGAHLLGGGPAPIGRPLGDFCTFHGTVIAITERAEMTNAS